MVNASMVAPPMSECMRPAVAPAESAPPETLRYRTHLSGGDGGRTDSIHTATPDHKKVLSVSCLVCWCELDD